MTTTIRGFRRHDPRTSTHVQADELHIGDQFRNKSGRVDGIIVDKSVHGANVLVTVMDGSPTDVSRPDEKPWTREKYFERTSRYHFQSSVNVWRDLG